MSMITSDQAEPPLITLAKRAHRSLKRRVWLTKKRLAPHAYRFLVSALAFLLLTSLNPSATSAATASAGPTSSTPQLAGFSFFSYEEVSLDDELALVADEGYLTKPLVVTTEIGRPEQALRDKQQREREAAGQRKLAAARVIAKPTSPAPTIEQSTTSGNTYAGGYCTWWAKSKRPDLPNQLGNAGRWLSNARNLGLATGSTPQAGSIVVTSESSLGHVGYVEAVNGDEITVSDMNMIGRGKISRRTMSAGSGVIKGFIY